MARVARFTRGIRNAKRLAEIVRVLTRHGFGEVVARLHLLDAIPAWLTTGLRLTPDPDLAKQQVSRGERLRTVLVELGPTYVKLGQVLSTRPDLIPPDICADLETLQDRVPPVSNEEAAQVILDELGHKPGEVFGTFEETPVASASISQVHRATLKDGAAVAVKVQRPGIGSVIEADVVLLGSVAQWIVERGIQTPGFDPVGTVEEFSRSVRRELDFVYEAQTVQRFARNFSGCDTLHVPTVYPDVSTSRVLTMEWIAGTSLRDTDRLRQEGHDLSRIAQHGVDVVLRQIFEHGLFLADLLLAVFRKDVAQATSAVLELAETAGETDRKALERDLHEFIEFDAERIMEGLAFGEVMNHAVGILRQHSLVLPARYTLLIKALATTEQVGRDLDPNLDIAAQIRPYVEQLLKRRYSARRVVSDASGAVREMVRLGRSLPSNARELISSFRRGGFKIALCPEDIRRLTDSHERSANRVTFGMIVGALIVGSSFLMRISGGPRFLGLPVIGLAGYLIAAILGLAMIFSMWRSRRL